MAIVYDESHLEGYVREAVSASPEHPVLIDCFLEDAYEVDVDALGDGERVVIGGIMEHIEEAGVHNGGSSARRSPHQNWPPATGTVPYMTRRPRAPVKGRRLMYVPISCPRG